MDRLTKFISFIKSFCLPNDLNTKHRIVSPRIKALDILLKDITTLVMTARRLIGGVLWLVMLVGVAYILIKYLGSA